MFWCEHANTRKHVIEHRWLSGWAILSILAHSAHLACFFSLILNRIKKMFWFKHTNTRKHVSEQSWLSGWNILIISAHLAHLAQFYFSLIFSAINTFNCFWFDLTNKKKFSDWRQKHGEKWPMFTTFFLMATASITGIYAPII